VSAIVCVLKCVPASLRMQIHFVEQLDGVGKVQMWIFGCITWVFCVFERKREGVIVRLLRLDAFVRH